MIPTTQKRVVVVRYPDGDPVAEDFRIEDGPVVQPGPGQVLVRMIYLVLDPYMRGVASPSGSIGLKAGPGEVMRGGGVGEVVVSTNSDFPVGSFVEGRLSWEEYAIGPNIAMRRVDPGMGPLSAFNNVLGMPGMTAYFGLFEFGDLRPGETMVVSGASGAAGSFAAQIAKITGCRVVGIAGGAEKCAWLTGELGLDGAIDYKAEKDIAAAVKRGCPEGVYVYFDCTGGPISAGVVANLNLQGRIVMVGGAGGASGPGPQLTGAFIGKRLTARGFIIFDHVTRWEPYVRIMSEWLKAGRIKSRDEIIDGLENAPEAFARMLKGRYFGKPQIRVSTEPGLAT